MADPVLRYASISDLQTLGVRAEALAKFTPVQKNEALDDASRTMDSYFRKQFTLPFVAVGGDLARACAAIAAYDLVSARGLNPEGNDENIRLRYLDAIKWLEMVAAGKVLPDVTDSSPAAEEGQSSGGGPRVVSSSSRGYSSRGDASGGCRGPFVGN